MPTSYGSKDYPVKEDNWEHRAADMKCKTCMAFVPKKNGLGRCRRNAPTIKGWVPVFEGDWCLEHRLDENKIGGSRLIPLTDDQAKELLKK